MINYMHTLNACTLVVKQQEERKPHPVQGSTLAGRQLASASAIRPRRLGTGNYSTGWRVPNITRHRRVLGERKRILLIAEDDKLSIFRQNGADDR